MILFLVLAGYAYKKRHSIARWLNDPYDANAYVVDRKTILKRKIEDATKELTHLETLDK